MTTPDRPDTHPETVVAEPGSQATADEIVADIEATRADLGDTVDALAHKLDVKAQAQHRVDDAKTRALAQARDLQARGTDLYAQAKDAATDDHGQLTDQARSIAIKGAGALAAVLLLRTIVRRRRLR